MNADIRRSESIKLQDINNMTILCQMEFSEAIGRVSHIEPRKKGAEYFQIKCHTEL